MSEPAGERAGAVALVALDGFVGSALRSAVDAGVGSVTGVVVLVPVDTLAANVLGGIASGCWSPRASRATQRYW